MTATETATPTSAAIEKRDEGPATLVKQYEQSFAAVLPSHITRPETWIRVAQGALKRGKKNADGRFQLEVAAVNNPGVFLAALLDCARMGLEPGTEQYYLTPRKVNGRDEILGIVGYQGYVELMYRAGYVSSVVVEVVYSNDRFEFSPGRDEVPVHEIDWDSEDRGELRLAYAYARMKAGGYSKVVVLTKAAITRIKAKSQGSGSSYSPWQTDPEAMWLKSAARQLRKWVPTSAEIRGVALATHTPVERPDPDPDLPPIAEPPSEFDDDDDVVDAELVDDDDDVVDAELVDDDDAGEPAPATGPAADPMTDPQSKALHALLRSERGVSGDARFPVLTEMLGRTVTSTKEISKDEASQLIDRLQDGGAED